MMKCKLCDSRFDAEAELIRHHVKKHRDDENFFVQCRLCHIGFSKVTSLRSHFRRHHKADSSSSPAKTNTSNLTNPPASVEVEQISSNSSGVRREPSDCYLELADLESSRSMDDDDEDFVHERSLPTDATLEFSDTLTGEDIWVMDIVDSDFGSEDGSYTDDSSEDEEDDVSEECASDPLTWESAKFLLNLREEGMVSQTALEKAVLGVDNLFHTYTEAIKDKLQQECEQAQSPISDEILERVFDHFTGGGMFKGVETKKRLDSFMKQSCQLLSREKVILRTEEVLDKTCGVKVIEHTAFICPFMPALKRLLTRPDVAQCIDNPVKVSTDGYIRSYRDGKYCKEHRILSEDGSLAVVFAYDDLEVSSPLGPKKHKLAFYYWTLANYYPPMRSSLKSINLYAIAWAKDLKVKQPTSKCVSLDLKFNSHRKIMSSFNSDMRDLEKGVEVQFDGSSRMVKGCLFCVTGDSPAVNVMFGGKESVGGALRLCHKCHATQEESKVVFNIDSFRPRTMQTQAEDLRTIDQSLPVGVRMENSVRCGLNGPSVIYGLENFDYVNCFVFDAMHVLHEGVLEAHMRMLCHYTVEKKILSIEEINSGVKVVADQFLKRDKPAGIKGNHLTTGLRQTAAQMFSLALCLPFVLMEKKEELGERLENFLLLLKISIGLLCLEVKSADVLELKGMARKHHETFAQHYPEFEITPKFHFLLHVVTQILEFGPTRVTWSMRFEAMHSYFKNLMRIMKNFKNPPKACSYRYECLRASQMLTAPGSKPSNFLTFSAVATKQVTCELNSYLFSSQLYHILGRNVAAVTTCDHVTVNGVKFEKNSVVMYSEMPITFAKVIDVVKYHEIIILLVSVFETVKYEPLCNAFLVKDAPNPPVRAVFPENLCFPLVLPCVTVSTKIFVIPKYHRSGSGFCT